jgi:uncharacterized protein (TIGR02145 family)
MPAEGLNGDYYQWGSKTAAATAYAINGTWSTTAPSTYYGDNTTGDNVTAKGNGDPCPTGYRIPSYDEWNGVLANNTIQRTVGQSGSPYWTGAWINGTTTWYTNAANWQTGIKFGDGLYLPAAGHYNASDGSLNYRGYYGYYWSSRAEGTSSTYSMYFGGGSTGVGYAGRPYGFSVRCISEY